MIRKLALIAIAGLIALPAAAQQGERGNVRGPQIKLPLSRPAGAGTAADQDSLGQALTKPFQDLANLIGGDIDDAITLSTAIPNLQDGNGQQCWIGLREFGAVVKAHPLPLTGRVVTDFEAARLMAMAANRLCANPHCSQVFTELANTVQKASPLPGLAVPSLASICTQIPQIAVAAPVEVPTATPTATAPK